jgi:hypothetical protein
MVCFNFGLPLQLEVTSEKEWHRIRIVGQVIHALIAKTPSPTRIMGLFTFSCGSFLGRQVSCSGRGICGGAGPFR